MPAQRSAASVIVLSALSAVAEDLVLVVGLPKAGTTSLQQYFECGNRSVTHWECGDGPDRVCARVIRANLAAGRAPLAGVAGTVHTQLDYWAPDDCYFPQADDAALDALQAFYPNATWILNTRPVASWVRSVSTFRPGRAGTGERFEQTLRVLLGSSCRAALGGLLRTAPAGPREPSDAELAAFYEDHAARVRARARARRRRRRWRRRVAAAPRDRCRGGRRTGARSRRFAPRACWPHANRWRPRPRSRSRSTARAARDVEPQACKGRGCRDELVALCHESLGVDDADARGAPPRSPRGCAGWSRPRCSCTSGRSSTASTRASCGDDEVAIARWIARQPALAEARDAAAVFGATTARAKRAESTPGPPRPTTTSSRG